jgi:hypothetical protein
MFRPFPVSCFASTFYDSVNIFMTMSDAHFIEPMPCLAVRKLPEGAGWEYELKLGRNYFWLRR